MHVQHSSGIRTNTIHKYIRTGCAHDNMLRFYPKKCWGGEQQMLSES